MLVKVFEHCATKEGREDDSPINALLRTIAVQSLFWCAHGWCILLRGRSAARPAGLRYTSG